MSSFVVLMVKELVCVVIDVVVFVFVGDNYWSWYFMGCFKDGVFKYVYFLSVGDKYFVVE